MKYKKILLSMLGVAGTATLTITSLTSCSSTKKDSDLRIELNDEGKFSDFVDLKTVLKNALLSADSQKAFKEAYTNIIIYKWYVERADGEGANKYLNDKYKGWKKAADKSWNDLEQSYKDNHGKEWQFYFTNEVLVNCCNSKDTWIQQEIIKNIRSDFQSNVFTDSYFGMSNQVTDPTKRKMAPRTAQSITVTADELKKSDSWDSIGWYGDVSPSYSAEKAHNDTDGYNTKYLKSALGGDYAAIQQATFDAWYENTKPYVSTAALFKYSAPAAPVKMSDIYNANSTQLGTTIDTPSIQFPYFGGSSSLDDLTSTHKLKRFLEGLTDSNLGWYQNGYLDIPPKGSITDDGSEGTYSTLYLCTSNDSFDTLDTSYATASASLYNQMHAGKKTTDPSNANLYTKNTIVDSINLFKDIMDSTNEELRKNNTKILDLFSSVDAPSVDTIKNKISASINIDDLYIDPSAPVGTLNPLFDRRAENLADPSAKLVDKKYFWDSFQTDITGAGKTQPFVFELNSFGMHAQSIDGYNFVTDKATEAERIEAEKQVLLFRGLQSKMGFTSGTNNNVDIQGKISSYFNENMDDIIIKMAMDDAKGVGYGVFTSLFDLNKPDNEKNNFYTTVMKEQKLDYLNDGTSDLITAYFNDILAFQKKTKEIKSQEAINTKIHDSSQLKSAIENSKYDVQTSADIFKNGLTSPLGYKIVTQANKPFSSPVSDFVNTDTNSIDTYYNNLSSTVTKILTIADKDGHLLNNSDYGISAQIKDAKKLDANQFWFTSYVINSAVQSYKKQADNNLSNGEKIYAIEKYVDKVKASFSPQELTKFNDAWFDQVSFGYKANKVLPFEGAKNLAYYNIGDTFNEYQSGVTALYDAQMAKDKKDNGEFSSDILSYETYRATVYYLISKTLTDREFTGNELYTGFYNVLKKKIQKDESAVIAYLAKDNWAITNNNSNQAATSDADIAARFGWRENINNFYDQYGYIDGSKSTTIADAPYNFAAYWNYAENSNGATMGFTGIQTKSSTTFENKVANAAFDKISISAKNDTIVQNTGAWFKYAGLITGESASEILANGQPASAFGSAGKLAKYINDISNFNDLKNEIKDIGTCLTGVNLEEKTFKDNFADTQKAVLDYFISDAIPGKMFDRLTNAQLHTTDIGSKDYLITDDNKSVGYNVMVTQINYEDVVNKNFTNNTPILSSSQLSYLIGQYAADTSIQADAIRDVVKVVYGSDKAVAYDVNMNNQLGTIWIKEWTSKI